MKRVTQWWLLVVAALIISMTGAPASHADPTPTPTVVGEPLADPIRALAQDQGIGLDGEPQAYWITDGKGTTPAMFQVTDVRTGERVFAARVASGLLSYDMEYSPSEKAVYVAMTDGSWYRWRVGSDQLETLPRISAADPALAGRAAWALGIAPDGVVYAGTETGAHLVEYRPDTGALRYLGVPIAGEAAIRSIVATSDAVYVGTESNGKFARVDRGTGASTVIPLTVTGTRGIMTMAKAGDLLLMRLRPQNLMLAYDMGKAAFVASYADMDGIASGLDPSGSHFYYFNRTLGVMKVDATTLVETSLGNRPSAIAESWAFVDMPGEDWPGTSISFTYSRGRNYINNYETRAAITWMEDKLLGTASALGGFAVDSAGRVVVGGQAGSSVGLGTYDAMSAGWARWRWPVGPGGSRPLATGSSMATRPQGTCGWSTSTRPWPPGIRRRPSTWAASRPIRSTSTRSTAQPSSWRALPRQAVPWEPSRSGTPLQAPTCSTAASPVTGASPPSQGRVGNWWWAPRSTTAPARPSPRPRPSSWWSTW